MSDIVQLNVGGTPYTTTRTTLTLYEDSMLGKMFNGTWQITQDDQGRCFVDRDGGLFRYVLNFQRTGDLVIPDEFPELQLLRCEAEFYQIRPLIEAVESEIQRRKRNSNKGYYLDVAEKTTFPSKRHQMCDKKVIICGHKDVIKCLPLGKRIVDCIQHYNVSQNVCITDRTGDIYVVSNGNSTEISARERGSIGDSLSINRSDLAQVLMANNCSLISSTSEIREFTSSDIPVFHCCDKWRIPEESLPLLAELKP